MCYDVSFIFCCSDLPHNTELICINDGNDDDDDYYIEEQGGTSISLNTVIFNPSQFILACSRFHTILIYETQDLACIFSVLPSIHIY